jgi:hypothetical protein
MEALAAATLLPCCSTPIGLPQGWWISLFHAAPAGVTRAWCLHPCLPTRAAALLPYTYRPTSGLVDLPFPCHNCRRTACLVTATLCTHLAAALLPYTYRPTSRLVDSPFSCRTCRCNTGLCATKKTTEESRQQGRWSYLEVAALCPSTGFRQEPGMRRVACRVKQHCAVPVRGSLGQAVAA